MTLQNKISGAYGKCPSTINTSTSKHEESEETQKDEQQESLNALIIVYKKSFLLWNSNRHNYLDAFYKKDCLI